MKTSFDLQTSCNKLNYRLCEGSVAVWLLSTSGHLKRLSYKICTSDKRAVKFRITRFNDCMIELSPVSNEAKNTLNSTFLIASVSNVDILPNI